MRPRLRLRIVREGPEPTPFVLRWIWYFAPLLVGAAAGGMVLAARSARHARPVGAALEVTVDGARILDGAKLHRGQTLRLAVAPAHARFVTVSTSAGQKLRFGPLAVDTERLELSEPVVAADPGPLVLRAVFDSEPPVSLAFDVE
jgi:hypothetical protein